MILWATMLGCAVGSLRWDDGDDVLRSALVQPSVDGGLPHLTVLLSNSVLPCDLPTDPDPTLQTQALLELNTALCREGAEHVRLELWRGDGDDWVGTYEADPEAGPLLVSAERPHLADGSWYGIDEAGVATVRDFVRTYGVPPGGSHRVDHLGTGSVEITDPDGLDGRFEFPETGLSGRFRGERCEPDATLFALLAASAVVTCPALSP